MSGAALPLARTGARMVSNACVLGWFPSFAARATKNPARRPGFRANLKRSQPGIQAAFSCSGSASVSASSLGQVDLDQPDRFSLRHAVDGRDLTRHAVECCLIELALGIGLLRLVVGAEQVAHDFRDRDEIAGIDLGIIFLGATRPHGALHPCTALDDLQGTLDIVLFRQLAHADRGCLGDRHLEAHLVLLEIDDEELQLVTGNFLLVDGHDLSDAMRGIDDVLAGLETVTRCRLLLLGGGCHYALNSLLWSRSNRPANLLPGRKALTHAPCKQMKSTGTP